MSGLLSTHTSATAEALGHRIQQSLPWMPCSYPRSIKVATPANWQPGDDTVVLPFISDEEAERMFEEQGGIRKVRSYLRYVRDPSLRCL